jgi:hypothetical protein
MEGLKRDAGQEYDEQHLLELLLKYDIPVAAEDREHQ